MIISCNTIVDRRDHVQYLKDCGFTWVDSNVSVQGLQRAIQITVHVL